MGNSAWRRIDRTDEVRAFLVEYEALCARHGMKVSGWGTEDDYGLELEYHEKGKPLPKPESYQNQLPLSSDSGPFFVNTFEIDGRPV
jgi:hypothetical protein